MPRVEAMAAKQAVAEVVHLRGGRLLLAAIPSLSACWLPEVIRSFREQFPKVELVLLEESSERVAELVELGRAELGFLQLPVKSGKLLETRELVKEPFVVLVPSGHALARQKSVPLAQCAQEPFVFYKGRAGDTAFAACRMAGFEPRVGCESSELATIRSLVDVGLGLAIVPKLAARELPQGVVALTLREPRLERKLGLIYRCGHEWSPAATKFAARARL